MLRVNFMGFPPFYTFKGGSIENSRGADLDLVNIVKDKLGINKLQAKHEGNFSLTFVQVDNKTCTKTSVIISILFFRL